MATILTKEQIRALYGAKNNEELVAFGRAIPTGINNPGRKRAQFTHDQLMKFRPKNVPQAAVEPDVAEQIL